ncbi:cell division protein FtsI (penicillin-binding protein 3) [Microbacterium ginsengiterrae]|uniref:Cell division protein FtsI (Penicillin-binding protein 3) n=1 Tax=Microbacterium ginsengiterrae TaxID=546115 RepID=A0A7W9FBY6_9MICO|nr:penicillin-binding protein 2 [Microbacterium ginsengiterrae]MBB5741599.1 cell division protein FtsI (penicillin-binding protein 3) [Microbacterium ginsengiterrae]
MTTRATRGPRRRTVVALAVILAVLSAFVVRLVDIQVVSANEHVEDSLHVGNLGSTETIHGDRGSIVDANGITLASSVKVYDAQLSPSLIMQLESDEDRPPKVSWHEAAERIAEIVGQDADKLRAAVAANLEENPHSQYYQLANGLSTEKYLELRDLGLVYLAAKPRETRVYPNGAVAGNVVGYVDNAGEGQAGVEQMNAECLAPTSGERTYLRGKDGVVIPGSERTVDAVDGGTVQLTINSDLQWYLQQMIAEEAQKQAAKAGTVTVVEVATGKIRAAAEWPSLDPNDLDASSPDDWGTRVFGTTFEPGSTFKAITAAAALDTGAVDMKTTISAAGRETFPNGAVINDPFRHDTYQYTIAGALIDSSNVALSKIGTTIDSQTRFEYMQKFGVGDKTISFPREEGGVVHAPENWDSQTLYATTFGQAFTVTAPQVAGAYQAIANGGEKIDLSLLESCTTGEGDVVTPPAPHREQIISEKTAAEVTRMLENVSVQGGLSQQIEVPGYRVATKTGTAQKADGGGYIAGKYFTSMVGFAPVDDPQYVVVVTLDEPTKVVSSAATAPAFQKAMTQVLKTYRVSPSTTPMDELLPKYN